MEIRQFKNILALRAGVDQPIWGFHSHNLEMAELTPTIWNIMAGLKLESSALDNENSYEKQSLRPIQDLVEIKNEIENWNLESSPDTTDAWDEFSVRMLSLNVVQICNLRCTYCAAGGDGSYGSPIKKMDLNHGYAQIRHFVNAFEPKNPEDHFEIQFLGGEPLLHPQIIRKLCQYARLCVEGTPKKVQFSVTTNGTTLSNEVADLLAEFNFSVALSLDGRPEVNDRTRPTVGQNRSSTELTVRGLKNLLRVREHLRHLKVNSVFGAHNMDIVDAYEYLISLYQNWTEINFLYANNEAHSDLDLTEKYIGEMQNVAALAYQKMGLSGLAQIKQFQSALARVAARTRIHSYCGAGKSFIQADTKGDLFACNWLMTEVNEKIGSGVAIDGVAREEYRAPLIEQNNCQTCFARHFCGGGCFYVHKSKTGDRRSKDPLFCRRTRLLGATALHYYALTQIN